MSQVDQHASLSDKAQARFDALVDQAATGQAEGGVGGRESAEFAELQWLGAVVRQETQLRSDEVPAATFDRLWQQVLPQLATQPSERRAPQAQGWRRSFEAWLSPWRLGWSLAGATAMVAALVLARSPSVATLGTTPTVVAERAGESSRTASDPVPMQVAARSDGSAPAPAVPAPSTARIAQAPAEIEPSKLEVIAEPPEAKVERIEFGGRSGRISHINSGRGVTTVIWLSDAEAEPQKVQDL